MWDIIDPMSLGFLSGLLICVYVVGRIVQSRHARRPQDHKLQIVPLVAAFIAGAIALYPAFFLGIVAGGNLGGGIGEVISMKLGHGSSGALPGVTVGIAIVSSSIVLLGFITGMGLGKAITAIARYNKAL